MNNNTETSWKLKNNRRGIMTRKNFPKIQSVELFVKQKKLPPDTIYNFRSLFKEYYPDMLLKSRKLSQYNRDILEKWDFTPDTFTAIVNSTVHVTEFEIKRILAMLSDITDYQFSWRIIIDRKAIDEEE